MINVLSFTDYYHKKAIRSMGHGLFFYITALIDKLHVLFRRKELTFFFFFLMVSHTSICKEVLTIMSPAFLL